MKNREISFRVWDTYLGNWGDPGAFLGITSRGVLISENELNTKGSVVQQFTGLKDKNSKKIFEGDIIEMNESGGDYCLGSVFFYKGSFVVNENAGIDEFSELGNNANYFEVIGNIFENPELLKQ